jgi:hypothetical protein
LHSRLPDVNQNFIRSKHLESPLLKRMKCRQILSSTPPCVRPRVRSLCFAIDFIRLIAPLDISPFVAHSCDNPVPLSS